MLKQPWACGGPARLVPDTSKVNIFFKLFFNDAQRRGYSGIRELAKSRGYDTALDSPSTSVCAAGSHAERSCPQP